MRFGLGPVFAFEWLASSRQWQGYAVRALFVAALLVALGLVSWWFTWGVGRSVSTTEAYGALGVYFFYAIIGTQLTLILLAAPAATAGSICLDKARGTLSHVLVTDLSDGEIVLGKLAARLWPVLALVACTLPLMELCSLLGGIDPDAVFGAFLITLGLAVLGASIAMAFSVWARKTHEVLLSTYAVWGLWLMIGPISTQVLGNLLRTPQRLDRALHLPLSEWLDRCVASLASLESFDPYRLAFRPYLSPATAKLQDDVVFLIVTLAISAVLAAVSVWKLRPAYIKSLGQALQKPTRLPRFERINRLWDVFDHLPGPSLDGNPVLWREWHRHRPSRLSRMVWLLYFVLAASFSVIAFGTRGPGAYAAWVNGMQSAIGIVLLSVSASTSLAEERVRGSLDVLLATPLSTFTILSGKWCGTFRLAAVLAVLPTLVTAGKSGLREQDLVYVVLMPTMILAYGASVTSLGLLLATWVRRLGRAVVLCLGAVLLVNVVWHIIYAVTFRPPKGMGMAMGSPFLGPAVLTIRASEVVSPMTIGIGWALFWILFYVAAAASLFWFTLVTFDYCLGRTSDYLGDAYPPAPAIRPAHTIADVPRPVSGRPTPKA
jgi:ABC-type transport system involved in multi-copper enzyme maturation permease subunit